MTRRTTEDPMAAFGGPSLSDAARGRLEAAQGTLAALDPPVEMDLHLLGPELATLASVAEHGEPGDWLLARACLLGNSAAIAEFHRRYEAPMRAVLGRTCRDRDAVDDLFQDLVVALLFSRPARAAKLGAYEGEGKLLTWLRVVAARAAIDRVRRRSAVLVSESVLEAAADLEGVALDGQVLSQYREDFRRAVSRAIAALEPRQRQLLRYHLAGASAGEIGSLLGAHRVTVSRWLGGIRTQIRAETLRLLEGSAVEQGALTVLLPHLSASFDRLLAAG